MGFRQKDALEVCGIAEMKAGRLDPREFISATGRRATGPLTDFLRQCRHTGRRMPATGWSSPHQGRNIADLR
jgi:hypothetical protein